MEVFIADPQALRYAGGALRFADTPIDMVYNRLTDFGLDLASQTALRAALLDERVVVTPSPRHHALMADKRNLTLFNAAAVDGSAGLSEAQRVTLTALPKTTLVSTQNADQLWAGRKKLFFKPASGYGSRAAYRGSKLTRRVWGEVVGGEYVAQTFVAPGVRALRRASGPVELKFDVRVYTYAGEVSLLAARIYQGQTTNFRTEGGGFAPVFVGGCA